MQHLFETEIRIKRRAADLFPFFADAHNLEMITPPWLHFKILSQSTPEMRAGTVLEYSLRIKKFPLRWTTLIESWNSNHSFVDTQVRGPYRLWHHTHEFFEENGETLMRDRVRYELPFGFLGEALAGWMVHRDVREIFRYRHEVISKLFEEKRLNRL